MRRDGCVLRATCCVGGATHAHFGVICGPEGRTGGAVGVRRRVARRRRGWKDDATSATPAPAPTPSPSPPPSPTLNGNANVGAGSQ